MVNHGSHDINVHAVSMVNYDHNIWIYIYIWYYMVNNYKYIWLIIIYIYVLDMLY
jgi:hypothetical protein